MPFEISTFAYRLTDRYVIARRNADLHRAEKKLFAAHPEWEPLTPEELSRVSRKDRYGYIFYKNMVGPENLELYLTSAPYTTVVLPKLNRASHRSNTFGLETEFTDKSCAELFVKDLSFPETIFFRSRGEFYSPARERISESEALALLEPFDEAVFKQSVGGYHGHGIKLASRAEYASLLTGHGSDYLVQKRIRQHPKLASFNVSSVNILRITTLFWHGDVSVVGSILRVGSPGAFCDHQNLGGETYLSIPVTDDGTILPRACDIDYGHVYDSCRGVPLGVKPAARVD